MSSTPPAAPRRIVTSHNIEGKSTQHDDLVEPEVLAELHQIRVGRYWATIDGLPTNDNNSQEDGGKRPVGLMQSGTTNFRYTDLAPHTQTPIHRTSSVDYNILRKTENKHELHLNLVHGEVIHVTEDGTEKHLKNPGDALIQRGTLHAWRNPTGRWARWASILVDAKPALVNGEEKGPFIPIELTK